MITLTVTLAAVETPGDLAASTERCAEAYRDYRRALADEVVEIDPVPVTYREIEQFDVGATEEAPESLVSASEALAERRRLLERGLPATGAILELVGKRIDGDKVVLGMPGSASLVRTLREQFGERVHVGALRGSSDDPKRVEAFLGADEPAFLVASPSHLAVGPALPDSIGVVALGTPQTAPGAFDVLRSTMDLEGRSTAALVGIPADAAGQLPDADGRAFLEAAARLRASAHDDGQYVRFTAYDRATERDGITLAREGAAWISRLQELRRFAWPTDSSERAALRAFLLSIDGGETGVLGRWGPPATNGFGTQVRTEDEADAVDGDAESIQETPQTDAGPTESDGEEAPTGNGDDRPIIGTDRFLRRRGTFERQQRTAWRSWHHYEPESRGTGPASLEAIQEIIESDGTTGGRSTDRPSDETVLGELRELAAVLGRPPQRRDVKKFGTRSPGVYTERFGSWGETLEAAGIHAGDEPAREWGIGSLLRRSVGSALRRLSPR